MDTIIVALELSVLLAVVATMMYWVVVAHPKSDLVAARRRRLRMIGLFLAGIPAFFALLAIILVSIDTVAPVVPRPTGDSEGRRPPGAGIHTLIELTDACQLLPKKVQVDVDRQAIIDIKVKIKSDSCTSPLLDSSAVTVKTGQTLRLELVSPGFPGMITAIGADTQNLDSDRIQAQWSWSIVGTKPGRYPFSLVASIPGATGQPPVFQNSRHAIEVEIGGTTTYYLMTSVRWLNELLTTTAGIVTGIVTLIGTVGTALLIKQKKRREKRDSTRLRGLRLPRGSSRRRARR